MDPRVAWRQQGRHLGGDGVGDLLVAAPGDGHRTAITDLEMAPAGQQPAAPDEGELGSPDRHRQHRGPGAPDQEPHPRLGGAHPAAPRSVTLHEDEQPAAAAEDVEADPQSTAIGGAPVHGEAVASGEQPGERRRPEHLALDHREEGAREEGADDHPVPVADVVGGDHERALQGYVRAPLELQTAEEEHPQEGTAESGGEPVAPGAAAVSPDRKLGGEAPNGGGHSQDGATSARPHGWW